jgi:hypothetical protein
VRWLVLVPLLGCTTTRTVVHVADPNRVSLVREDDRLTYLPAESPPAVRHELEPGLTALRGSDGALSLSCAQCEVDDAGASGIWLSGDGVTEGLDTDARSLAFAPLSGRSAPAGGSDPEPGAHLPLLALQEPLPDP